MLERALVPPAAYTGPSRPIIGSGNVIKPLATIEPRMMEEEATLDAGTIEGKAAPTFFEPTNSWCYRFARYKALPEISAMPEVLSGEPFRLIELSRRVLDNSLTLEQQAARFRRAQTGQELAIAACVKWYIPFLAKQTGQLVPLGGGMYRLPTVEDVDQDAVDEAALEAGEDEVDEFDGWIYAFSFQALIKEAARYPLKIGKTAVDVDARVLSQCKGSASFDLPQVLGRWRVNRVGAMELAIHNVLKARGQWREQAPGTEWFDATPNEVEAIIAFVGS